MSATFYDLRHVLKDAPRFDLVCKNSMYVSECFEPLYVASTEARRAVYSGIAVERKIK